MFQTPPHRLIERSPETFQRCGGQNGQTEQVEEWIKQIATPVNNASPSRKAARFTRRMNTSRNTMRLCTLRRGVSPTIIAKQNPREICPGSVSEFKTRSNLARSLIIPVRKSQRLIRQDTPELRPSPLSTSATPTMLEQSITFGFLLKTSNNSRHK